MSQAGIISTSSGPVPPSVPTSFTTDLNDTTILPGDIPPALGTSTPLLNVERLSGDDGIKTVATPNAAANNVTIRFIRGRTTTAGAVTSNLITQATLSNTTMTIQIIIAGYGSNNDGIGYYGTAVVKNVAGTATLINTVDLIKNSDASLAASNATVTVSGGNLLVNVLGVAGVNIDWGACLPGITVSEQ